MITSVAFGPAGYTPPLAEAGGGGGHGGGGGGGSSGVPRDVSDCTPSLGVNPVYIASTGAHGGSGGCGGAGGGGGGAGGISTALSLWDSNVSLARVELTSGLGGDGGPGVTGVTGANGGGGGIASFTFLSCFNAGSASRFSSVGGNGGQGGQGGAGGTGGGGAGGISSPIILGGSSVVTGPPPTYAVPLTMAGGGTGGNPGTAGVVCNVYRVSDGACLPSVP